MHRTKSLSPDTYTTLCCRPGLPVELDYSLNGMSTLWSCESVPELLMEAQDPTNSVRQGTLDAR